MSSSRLLDKRINYSLDDIIRLSPGKVRGSVSNVARRAETPLDRLQQRMLALVRFRSIRDANNRGRRNPQFELESKYGSRIE
jgi:hypothetical protein